MKEKNEALSWNERLCRQEHSPFLQSYEWGTFQTQRGFEALRLSDERGAVQAIRYPILGGYSYWYAPYHPLLDDEGYMGFFQKCQDSTPKTVFVRFEPHTTISFTRTSEENSPSTTLIRPLSSDSEKILSGMHPKTRYNIGLAQRKGVRIQQVLPSHMEYPALCEEVIDLFRSTGERQAYRVQTREYFKLLLSSFSHAQRIPHELSVRLYCATYRDTLLAAILVVYFGDTATYLYGGSAPRNREAMTPYALQWTAIQDACIAECRYYDFWGIAPNDDPSHPWAGITRFKKGFGGETVKRPGTFDYVMKPFEYRAYSILRSMRRMVGRAQKG